MNAELTTVYFDMDGVLADFEFGFFNYFKIKLCECSKKEIWKNITKALKAGRPFFYDLPKLPQGITLLKEVLAEGYKVEILSSCGTNRYEEIKKQKIAWLREHVPRQITIYNFVQNNDQKDNYAAPNAILVDDTAEAIQSFIENGGIGWLFPRCIAKK